MIYLNFAATAYPKPTCVIQALTKTACAMPMGQYRSSADFGNEDLLISARTEVSSLLGVAEPNRVFFTSGATHAANVIIHGVAEQGGGIITTQQEHNSILRPLYNQSMARIRIVPCDAHGRVTPEDIEAAISPQTHAIFINHMSNVTGCIQDIDTIGQLASEYGILLFVDVSQSLGCCHVSVDKWQAAGAIFTGHKALSGPCGIGGFFLREGVELSPLMYGGTGIDSDRLYYEDTAPYEVGTQNLPAIAGLFAACRRIREIGISTIQSHNDKLRAYLITYLAGNRQIRLYGPTESPAGGIVSFSMNGMRADDLAFLLHTGYGIVTRSGLQCAPLIHQAIGSPKDGVVRVSFGYETTIEEIDVLISALRELNAQEVLCDF